MVAGQCRQPLPGEADEEKYSTVEAFVWDFGEDIGRSDGRRDDVRDRGERGVPLSGSGRRRGQGRRHGGCG